MEALGSTAEKNGLLVLPSANGGKPEDIYAHLRDRRK